MFCCAMSAMRAVLSDWWNASLFEMETNDALKMLIKVFDEQPVFLRPLARQISDIHKCNSEIYKPTAESKKLPLSKIMEEAITSSNQDRKCKSTYFIFFDHRDQLLLRFRTSPGL